MNFKKHFNEITIQSSLITIAFIAVCLAVYLITLPFIDYDVLNRMLKEINHSNIITARSNFSFFALGVYPLISSIILVKITSKIIKIFRNNKESKEEEKIDYMNKKVLILTLILIIIQGIGISYYLESLRYFGETIEYLVSPDLNPYLFRTSIVLSFIIGSFSLIFLAHKLDKKLIINGYILLLIIQFSVSFGPKTIKKISSSITNTKSHIVSYSIPKKVLKYELNQELVNNKELLGFFDESMEIYIKSIDKFAKYNRSNDTIEISAKKETINKIKTYFSEQHSFEFIGEDQVALDASKKIIENTKNLPDSITTVKSSYSVEMTGETLDDYYFKTKSASKEDETVLKNFTKTLKLPKGYKFYYEVVSRGKESYFRTYVLKGNSALSGLLIKEVISLVDPRDNSPYVSITFNKRGSELFAEITGELKGRRLAIVVDGIINSAPIVQDRITGGRASITLGAGSYQEKVKKAEELRKNLAVSRLSGFIKLKK